LYPGDRDGDIKEWINCRCTTVPYIIPYGYIAPPGRVQFREEDLVKIADDIILGRRKRETFNEVGEVNLKEKTYPEYNLKISQEIVRDINDINHIAITDEEIISTYNNLPTKLKDATDEIIVIYRPHPRSLDGGGGGRALINKDSFILFVAEHPEKISYFNHVMPHEMAHLLKNVDIDDYALVVLDDIERNANLGISQYPSNYSLISLKEDLAESVAYYLKNPVMFEENFYNRAKFVKEILGL
jgi:hypothetical protein